MFYVNILNWSATNCFYIFGTTVEVGWSQLYSDYKFSVILGISVQKEAANTRLKSMALLSELPTLRKLMIF